MRRLLGVSFVLLMSAACGGGGGSGGGAPADAVAQGTITGTGSIAVTGTLFDTPPETVVELDGAPGVAADLAVGMQVTVEGSRTDDTGTADLVTFDDDLEGTVESVVEVVMDEVTELTILGQTVVLEDPVTLFEGTSFDTIDAGDLVEVSGLRDGDGAIHATWVRLVAPATPYVSLEGEVESLTDGRFVIGAIEVFYDETGAGTDLPGVPEGGLAEGDFVDVLGVPEDADTVDARDPVNPGTVELEERAFEDGLSNLQLEGIVSEFVTVANFEIDGQPVNAGRFGVSFEPGGLAIRLADGDRVEVEGDVRNGVLLAEAVKLRAGEVRIDGALAMAVDAEAGTFELLDTADIEVDGATRFDGFASLAALALDDLLQVRGVDLGGVVRATEISRVGGLAQVRVRGRLQGFDASDRTFRIVGVELETDGSTVYQDIPGVANQTAFYTFLSACPSALLDVRADAAPDPHVLEIADTIALEEDCTP